MHRPKFQVSDIAALVISYCPITMILGDAPSTHVHVIDDILGI